MNTINNGLKKRDRRVNATGVLFFVAQATVASRFTRRRLVWTAAAWKDGAKNDSAPENTADRKHGTTRRRLKAGPEWLKTCATAPVPRRRAYEGRNDPTRRPRLGKPPKRWSFPHTFLTSWTVLSAGITELWQRLIWRLAVSWDGYKEDETNLRFALWFGRWLRWKEAGISGSFITIHWVSKLILWVGLYQ